MRIPRHFPIVDKLKSSLLIGLALSVLLVFNLFQVMFWLMGFISPKLNQKGQRFLGDRYWTFLIRLIQHFYHFELTLYDEQIRPEDNAVLVVNHQSEVDVFVVLALADRMKRVGDLRFFAKDSLKFIPAVGWGMWFLGCIFLKRRWALDRNYMVKRLTRFYEEDIPLWLVIFPEGTRATPKKIKRAQQTQRRAQRPILKHVLPPHARGLYQSLTSLDDHLPTMYDITITYQGRAPTLQDMLRGEPVRVAVTVERLSTACIPRDFRSCQKWLEARYIAKDQLLDDRRSEAEPIRRQDVVN
jgi:1-acyl-sn-glycerol-3-phosphate acyltransferase